MSPVRQLVRDLMVLTKFRINVVGVFTGYAALLVHGALHPDMPGLSLGGTLLLLLALLLTGGAANACNQIVERERDGRMARTRNKRPLPSGRMRVSTAVLLALAQQVGAVLLFVLVFDSWLGAALSLFTSFYYVVIYTWLLKPRHYLNIVIGGVPGAMGPLMAWAAVAQDLDWPAVALFAIIFLWTPPHFWALAIRLREDYAKAGIPMLPVVKGVDETTRQIFIYTVILVAGTLLVPLLLPAAFGASPVFFITACLGGLVFLVWTWRLWKRRPVADTMPLFHWSILYIGLLFTAVIVDALIMGGRGHG